MLNYRRTHLLVAVSRHQLPHGPFEVLPRADLCRQYVVHASNWLDLLGQNQPPSATDRARTTRPERLMENWALPSGCNRLAMGWFRPLNSTDTPDALPNTTRRG